MQKRLTCTLLSLMTLVGYAKRAAPAGEYNPRNFGAKGDGTTDDTAAIRACFEAASAAGGGVVRSRVRMS